MTASRPTPPSDRAPRHGERLRLGLTGLGAIFLIVLVVAAGLRPTTPPAETARQGESLAVLGVAPGAGPTETGPTAAAPATSAPAPAASSPPIEVAPGR